jgi:hypothetical protein
MMRKTVATPSEIEAELQHAEQLVSELPTPKVIDIDALQSIASEFFGSHPRYNEFLQAINRSLING